MTARIVMRMRVAAVAPAGEGVVALTLRHPWRQALPAWEPGAHVDLRLPDGRVRQYSLCGDPDDRATYRIAVKLKDNGRGGSRWVHETLGPGAEAHVSAPRNNFPLQDAAHHVFIAGGIGITPMVAMLRRLAAQGRSFSLHLCSRSPAAPLLDELRALCGDRLRLYVPPAARFDPAAALAAERAPDTAVYCCGPERLTAAVRDAMVGWPPDSLHVEVFEATVDENFKPEPFDIRIASTGETIRVPADRSALEVLRERGLVLPSSCEIGVCGSCETGYRDGVVLHRDSVLGVGARQDRMMLCVSRARVAVTLEL